MEINQVWVTMASKKRTSCTIFRQDYIDVCFQLSNMILIWRWLNQVFRNVERLRFSFRPLFPVQASQDIAKHYFPTIGLSIPRKHFQEQLELEILIAFTEDDVTTRFGPIDIARHQSGRTLLPKVQEIAEIDRLSKTTDTVHATTVPFLEGAVQTPTTRQSRLTPEQNKEIENHILRVEEESFARSLMADKERIWWLDYYHYNYDGFHQNDQKLKSQVRDFVATKIFDHLTECQRSTRVTDMRLLTFETIKAFDHLHSQNWTPRNMTNPHDRYIRESAGTEISPAFSDPGNDVYCLIYHILRLDRYLNETAVLKVIKTPATEYGTGRNKSSVGVVNLRGNIIEAILTDLQYAGTDLDKSGSSKRKWT